MIRGFLRNSIEVLKTKNVIFHVKLLSPTLKEASSFSYVIDFSSEKYNVVTGQQVLLVSTNEDKVRSRGTQSFLHTRGPSKTPNFTPNVLSSLCQKTKKYEKGLQIPYNRYHILQISENCLHLSHFQNILCLHKSTKLSKKV